jgi:hypothetical protein
VAVFDKLPCHIDHDVARDREADPGRRRVAELGIQGRQGGDADDLAGQVDQGAAAVAGIDLGARLDDVGQRDGAGLRHLPVDRADDALGDAALETEGLPTARTMSPTTRVEKSPKVAGLRFVAATWITAMSPAG